VLKSQDFDYLYEDNSKPNAVTRIGDNIYHYDASGNVTDIDPVLHNSRYCTKYLFNGKELDTETCLVYYGARYYSPELCVWYGVDTLYYLTPENSPYKKN
jgi:RHS repeat-associated protein